MLKLVSLVAVGLAFEENAGWTDYFGWTCRDYTRVPDECSSMKAFNDAGVHAEDACFTCNERRRQGERRRLSSNSQITAQLCQSGCSSNFNSCTQRCDQCQNNCDNTLVNCQSGCPSGTVTSRAPPITTRRPENKGFPWWIPVLIGLALLCLLCTACALLYMFCRPTEQGDCSQAEDNVPMIIASPQQGCAAPAEPCNSGGCDAGYEQDCAGGNGGGQLSGGGNYGYGPQRGYGY